MNIRELQRHTRAVLERVAVSGQILITKHGRVIARIIPPGPAEAQINAAIEAGILDPRALTGPHTNRPVLQKFGPDAGSTEEPSPADAPTGLRADGGER